MKKIMCIGLILACVLCGVDNASAGEGSPDWSLVSQVTNCNNQRECTWK